MPLSAGDRLGPYDILGAIGAGGMGEVYRARDPRLNRDVAIKVLPDVGAGDPDRRERFVREARAIAALNHPNIVTIHSVEEAEGRIFLTMEIVEGRSLADLLAKGALPLDAVLKVAIAVADAIAAAHQKGITHRDLKPANVMLGEGDQAGRVKVLDFGLAKLAEAPLDVSGLRTTAAADPITGEGRILGTVAYMSPEQAQGKPIDARSDLFSLGVLLFEMATGQRPFTGETSMSVISSILKDTPRSVSDLNAALPRDLGRIVRRALAKDPERRYQTAKDLRNDLEELKASLDSGELDAPAAPVSRPTTTRRRWLAVAAVIAAVIVGAGVYVWRSAAARPAPFERVEIRRLTTSGTAQMAAISPDGRYIVHVHDEGGQRSLWMRQIATGSNVQIAPPSDDSYLGLAFSPDATFVFFSRGRPGTPAALYQMPVLGGPARRIRDRVGQIAISPDGSRIAYSRRESPASPAVLMTVDVDGADERELARLDAPDFFNAPSWSPDGSLVAVTVQRFEGSYHGSVFVIPAGGGSLRQVGSRVWYAVRDVVWVSPSSLALIAADQTEFPDGYQVWSMSHPAGDVRKITNGLNSHSGLSAAADGSSLVTVLRDPTSTLWVSPADNLSGGRQITTGPSRRDRFPAWTPDGRLVHTAFGNGREVWIREADGSGARPLVGDKGLATHVSVCGDSRVVFTSDRGGGPHVWQAGLDGSDLRQLVDLPRGESHTACSRDGQIVVFVAYDGRRLMSIGPNGPEPLDDTGHPATWPAVSPDSRWIAYSRADAPGSTAAHLAVIPAAGSGTPRRFDFAQGSRNLRPLGWRPDSTAITYVVSSRGVDTIWRQPIAGGAPTPLATFSSGQLYEHAWSADGRLATARGSTGTDVVLLSAR
jgi:Tol biopolymer transport system component